MESYTGCNTNSCPEAIYHHEPSVAGNAALLALFALLIPSNFILGIKYQSSAFATTVITGLALEVMGYIGRLLLVQYHQDKNALTVAQVGTILGPSFFCLAIFRLMPRIVAVFDDSSSVWTPSWHNATLFALAVLWILCQLIGAIMLGMPNDAALFGTGVHLVVAGLALQIFSILLFSLLCIRFAYVFRRTRRNPEAGSLAIYKDRRFQVSLCALGVATLLLLIRTLYRIVSLSPASGSTYESEVLFLVLDGALVFVAAVILQAFYPGNMLRPAHPESTTNPRSGSLEIEEPQPPIPVRSSPAAYSPTFRMSMKSTVSSAPKRQAAIQHEPQRRMVDSDALW